MLNVEKAHVGDRYLCKIPIGTEEKYQKLDKSQFVITRIIEKGDKPGHFDIYVYGYKDGMRSKETLLPTFAYQWLYYLKADMIPAIRAHKIETSDLHKALADLDYYVGRTYIHLKDEHSRRLYEVKLLYPLHKTVEWFYEAYGRKEKKKKLDATNNLRLSISVLYFNLQSLVTMRAVSPQNSTGMILLLNSVAEQARLWETSQSKKLNGNDEGITDATRELASEAGALGD